MSTKKYRIYSMEPSQDSSENWEAVLNEYIMCAPLDFGAKEICADLKDHKLLPTKDMRKLVVTDTGSDIVIVSSKKDQSPLVRLERIRY